MIQKTLKTRFEFYEKTCPILEKQMYTFELVFGHVKT
jgi:hypothetical protein